MSEREESVNAFRAYDFKKISVNAGYLSQYLDGYESFGWHTDERTERSEHLEKISLQLKRERSILNKAELTRLQRNFEACMQQIQILEHSKYTQALIAGILTGLIGTVFVTGSVFAVIASPPILWLTILLGIPGLALWAATVPVSHYVKKKRNGHILPLVEAKYEEMYGVCEKGTKLLRGR